MCVCVSPVNTHRCLLPQVEVGPSNIQLQLILAHRKVVIMASLDLVAGCLEVLAMCIAVFISVTDFSLSFIHLMANFAQHLSLSTK